MKPGEIWKSRVGLSPFASQEEITIKLLIYLKDDLWECQVIKPEDFGINVQLKGDTIYRCCNKSSEA